MRRALPWDPKIKLRVRVGDAREVLTAARDSGYDVVIADVFAGARTPAHLASAEFFREAARVLAPTGWLIARVSNPAACSSAMTADCSSAGRATTMAGRAKLVTPYWVPGRAMRP